MKSQQVSKAKTAALMVLTIPFLAHCKGEKEFPKIEDIYKTQTCADPKTQHFDGKTLSCIDNVQPIAVTGFESFGDKDFNDRGTSLTTFISQYVTTNLPEYTLSVAPTCVETIEYNSNLNSGFYSAARYNTFECAFTLSDANGAVLTFERQDSSVGVVPAAGEKPPTYKTPVLKVVQSVDTNAAKLLICTYKATAPKLFEKDGKYDPNAEADTTFYPVLTSCVDYGSSIQVPSNLAALPANLQAFPRSFNTFLTGERTKYEVGGQEFFSFASARATATKKLDVTCGTTTYTWDVELKRDPANPISGSLTFTGADAAAFFDSSEIASTSGAPFTKSRSVLGCNSVECLNEAEISYKFFGSYLVLETKAARDVWKVDASDTAHFAEAGPANVAPICAYTYAAASAN
jgi:hypothetical protein